MITLTVALACEGGAIAQSLHHDLFTAILQEYVVNGQVNYAAIGNDKPLAEYLAQLSRSNPRAIKDEKERDKIGRAHV